MGVRLSRKIFRRTPIFHGKKAGILWFLPRFSTLMPISPYSRPGPVFPCTQRVPGHFGRLTAQKRPFVRHGRTLLRDRETDGPPLWESDQSHRRERRAQPAAVPCCHCCLQLLSLQTQWLSFRVSSPGRWCRRRGTPRSRRPHRPRLRRLPRRSWCSAR